MIDAERDAHIMRRRAVKDAAVKAYTGKLDDELEHAIRRRAGIRFEIEQDAIKWPNLLANTMAELMEWVRGQLMAIGCTAAAEDVNPRTMVEYAYWIADHYLSATRFGIAAELHGDDQQNYWRAVAIIRNHCPDIRRIASGT